MSGLSWSFAYLPPGVARHGVFLISPVSEDRLRLRLLTTFIPASRYEHRRIKFPTLRYSFYKALAGFSSSQLLSPLAFAPRKLDTSPSFLIQVRDLTPFLIMLYSAYQAGFNRPLAPARTPPAIPAIRILKFTYVGWHIQEVITNICELF